MLKLVLQYGVQVVTRQFGQVDDTSAFLGIMYVRANNPHYGKPDLCTL